MPIELFARGLRVLLVPPRWVFNEGVINEAGDARITGTKRGAHQDCRVETLGVVVVTVPILLDDQLRVGSVQDDGTDVGEPPDAAYQRRQGFLPSGLRQVVVKEGHDPLDVLLALEHRRLPSVAVPPPASRSYSTSTPAALNASASIFVFSIATVQS